MLHQAEQATSSRTTAPVPLEYLAPVGEKVVIPCHPMATSRLPPAGDNMRMNHDNTTAKMPPTTTTTPPISSPQELARQQKAMRLASYAAVCLALNVGLVSSRMYWGSPLQWILSARCLPPAVCLGGMRCW